MSTGWDGFDPAPIEVFHAEAHDRFFEEAKQNHTEIVEKAFGRPVPTINGIQFSRILAEFKTKIMKEYGISNNPIPKAKT